MNVVYFHLRRSLRTSNGYFNRHVKKTFASDVSKGEVIRSPAPFLQLPKGNFVDLLFRDAKHWETKTALECAETGRTLSFAELAEQSEKWSGFLKQVGVSKGDVVAIVSPNCVQYGPIFLGTASVGAALSPLNWKATPDEIRRMLEINQTTFVIFSPETEEKVLQALKGQTESMWLLSIGKARHERAINVNEILDGSKPTQTSPPDKLTGEEIIYMPFSSGTTGPPKAVALSHNAWIANTLQFTNPYHEVFLNFPEDVTMGMMPFFHVYGMLIIFSIGLLKGNKIVIVPKFDPQFFINTIIKHKVNFLHCVPTLVNLLNNCPQCTPETMGHISTLLCGAAPFHESTSKIFKTKIRKEVVIIEGYGLTETLITHLIPRKDPRLGACGQLLSNVEAKVIDLETGECLGPNQNGEICVKTPSMMKEYVNNPEGTNAILKGQWAHTGDIGYYDSQGFFSIVDRTKELIKVQGMQISPSEIEDELLKHGSVAECSVIGVPDERTGEAPKAFIVLKEKATVEDLNRFLEPRLSKHKQLRGGITFVESLPKSETGKVLRRVLKTMS